MNYDTWKLESPYDSDNFVEVFKVDSYEYYTTCESLANLFDQEMSKASDLDLGDYDCRQEFLEDFAEDLADKMKLQSSEYDAVEYHWR